MCAIRKPASCAGLGNGQFREPFAPDFAGYGSDCTEGNAWQYSWYVPQDVAGLISAFGGDARFTAKLDQIFDAKVDPARFEDVEDITGLIGWYAHGNEPGHLIAYLCDYAGRPWKTQQRLKQIMDTQYAPRPDGLSGNDDLGPRPGTSSPRWAFTQWRRPATSTRSAVHSCRGRPFT